MRIAVDLLSLGYGGSESYPREVLPRVAQSEHEFAVLLHPRAGCRLRDVLSPGVTIIDAPAATRSPFLRQIYQKTVLPRWLHRNSFDVLFVPGGVTGTRRGPGQHFKLVTMLRNMLPFDLAQRASYAIGRYPYMRLRLRLLSNALLNTFRRVDRLIFISQYSRDRVLPLVGHVAHQVIPHGIAEARPQCGSDMGRKFELLGVRDRFVLYVSILDPYKHQLEVIHGFRRFKSCWREHQALQLVLAGPISGHYGRAVVREAEQGQDDVICTGPLTPAELVEFRRRAEVLLFASTCETCPNVLMEYLGAARPIICSRTLPMPEFGGDAVEYVEATSPQAWADAFSGLYRQPDQMRRLARRAQLRSQLFSWDQTADKTLAALTQW